MQFRMKLWLSVLLWGALPLLCRARLRLEPPGAPTVPAPHTRRLVDGFQFRNQNFYDEDTAKMRDFLDELRSPSNSDTNQAVLETVYDPDNTATTGNGAPPRRVSPLLPAFDPQKVNERTNEAATAYQLKIKERLRRYSLDLFSEDPNVFLGDRETYFVIIKKRGLVFYYLSRAVLYGLLVFVLVQLMVKDADRQPIDLTKQEVSPQRTRKLALLQMISIAGVLCFSVGALIYVEYPKSESAEAFSNLYYTFKEISERVSTVVSSNKALNAKKVKLPGRGGGRFTVQDRLSAGQAQELADADMQKVDSFLRSSGYLLSLTDNMPLIVVSLGALSVLGVAIASKKHKSSRGHFVVFVVAGVLLAYLLGFLGQYIVGFSGLNDMCLGILRYGQNPILPFQGVGVTGFLGSSVENVVFQQLYINTIAQNSALALYNGELKAMDRPPVSTPAQAVKTTAYLRRLDSATDELEAYTDLLEANTRSLSNLLQLSRGNAIKYWLNDAQKGLCMSTFAGFNSVFRLYIGVIVFLLATAVVSLVLSLWLVHLARNRRAKNVLMHADHYANAVIKE